MANKLRSSDPPTGFNYRTQVAVAPLVPSIPTEQFDLRFLSCEGRLILLRLCCWIRLRLPPTSLAAQREYPASQGEAWEAGDLLSLVPEAGRSGAHR